MPLCYSQSQVLKTCVSSVSITCFTSDRRSELRARRSNVLSFKGMIKERLVDTYARKINDLISKETHRSTVVDQEKWVVSPTSQFN